MAYVFGAEEAGCFGLSEWGSEVGNLGLFWTVQVGFGDCLRVVLIVCL